MKRLLFWLICLISISAHAQITTKDIPFSGSGSLDTCKIMSGKRKVRLAVMINDDSPYAEALRRKVYVSYPPEGPGKQIRTDTIFPIHPLTRELNIITEVKDRN